MLNILLTSESATVIVRGEPYTVDRSHQKFDALIEAYNTGDVSKVEAVIDSLSRVKQWADTHNLSGKVKIAGGVVYYDGEYMDNVVSNRIIEWVDHGLDPQPMMNFLERIMANPSYQSREELLLFLEHSNLPIQEDGRFLAYKRVRANYTDCYSGKFDNSVGQIVEMPRASVDDNRNNTCSAGLHFCSKEYLNHFWGENIMLLAIDPADVVSIPYDYNNAKGRACRYEVIGQVGEVKDFDSPLYTSPDAKKPQPRDQRGNFVKEEDEYILYLKDSDGDTYFIESFDEDGRPNWEDNIFGYEEDIVGKSTSFSNFSDAKEYYDTIDSEYIEEYLDWFDLEMYTPAKIIMINKVRQLVFSKKLDI